MRKLAILAFVWPLTVAAEPAVHFAPQAFLAGACWKGTFADGKSVDEHCFEWMYGGQFLRDRHTVTGGPAPYGGETIYYYDAAAKNVQYIYFNVLGGHSRGSVATRDGALVFPEDKYSDGKIEQTYRSQWRRDGDDAYVVITEVKVDGGWKEAWRVRMQRQK
jgi:hypothetical protein